MWVRGNPSHPMAAYTARVCGRGGLCRACAPSLARAPARSLALLAPVVQAFLGARAGSAVADAIRTAEAAAVRAGAGAGSGVQP